MSTVDDLRFDLRNTESYELIAKSIEKTNFLEWAGLQNSIPSRLKIHGNESFMYFK